MATMATFFRRSELAPARETSQAPTQPRALRLEANPYKLRALPNDDIYFFTKRVDNSGLVRQADPKTRGECWKAIGAACILAGLLGGVMTPHISGTMAGYKLQTLKAEHQVLMNQRRVLDTEEAALLSTTHLNGLAARGQLASPAAGQVVHLEPRAENSMAMNVAPNLTSSAR